MAVVAGHGQVAAHRATEVAADCQSQTSPTILAPRRRLGLFDEAFRLYGEDLDWAYRIKAAGWRVRYHPAVVVLHYKRQSTRQRPVSSIRAFYEAMHIFYDKHYARQHSAPFNALIHLGIAAHETAALLRNRFRPPA